MWNEVTSIELYGRGQIGKKAKFSTAKNLYSSTFGIKQNVYGGDFYEALFHSFKMQKWFSLIKRPIYGLWYSGDHQDLMAFMLK